MSFSVKGLMQSAAGILSFAAPFAMFIPGFQWVPIAAMALNVTNGLMQKPPDWAGVMTTLLTQALPMGMGKALKAFSAMGGGTALEFAKVLSKHLSSVLGEVSGKLAGKLAPEAAKALLALQEKVMSAAFQQHTAKVVSLMTRTASDAHLSADQISNAMAKTTELAAMTLGHFSPSFQQMATEVAPHYQAPTDFHSYTQPPMVMGGQQSPVDRQDEDRRREGEKGPVRRPGDFPRKIQG